MEDFIKFQNVVVVKDMGFSGSSFTWCHDHPISEIWERLDRVLVNDQLAELYPHFSIQHGHRALSDHSPVLCLNEPKSTPRYKSSFKFQNMWLS